MRRSITLISLLAVLMPFTTRADDDAHEILRRVLVNRPSKDLSLKARLFVDRQNFVPVTVLIRNTPTDTRTIYRGADTELLVIQPVAGEASYHLLGQGELTGPSRMGKLLKSEFVFYDLGLPFLHWPQAKRLPDERTRGRDCYRIDVRGEDKPYASVRLWIDKEYGALLRAEAIDKDGFPVRRFTVNSFKRLGEIWIPKGIESATVPAGQALPAQDRSQLEVYQGDYDAKLPADWFDPLRFAPKITATCEE